MKRDVLRSSSASDRRRIDGIDALRALAIFYVLMNHVNMRLLSLHYLRSVPPGLADALVWQGQAGVQIFFAVSGFLITSTSLRRWPELGRLRVGDFYLLRFARIAPLLLTLVGMLCVLHALGLPDYVVSAKVGGLKAALVAAFTLRIGLLEATRGYLPGSWDILWSLSVEEAFYLGFPLVCRLLGRGRLLVIALLSFVLLGPFGRTVLTHGNEVWQEYSYLGGMDAIALGCLMALATARRTFTRKTITAWTVSGLMLLGFCLGFSQTVRRLGLSKAGLGMSVLAVGTCMLIAAAAQSQWQAPRMLGWVLVYGRRSYEIYLTHMFVVFGCFHFFMRHTGRSLRMMPVLFVVTIVFAGLLGELVGRYFSEPANRWIRLRFRAAASVGMERVAGSPALHSR